MKTKTTWLFKYWFKNGEYDEKYFSTKKKLLKFAFLLDWVLIETHLIKKVRVSVSKKRTLSYQEFYITSKNKIYEWLNSSQTLKGGNVE